MVINTPTYAPELVFFVAGGLTKVHGEGDAAVHDLAANSLRR